MMNNFFNKRKQQKLRPVKSVEVGSSPELKGDDNNISKSLPVSPRSGSRSPHWLQPHWSVSAVPQPLPLPNDDSPFMVEGQSGGGGSCNSHRFNMNTKDHVASMSAKSPTYPRRGGFPLGIHAEKVSHNYRLDVPARSAPTSTFTSPAVSPRFSTVDIIESPFVFSPEFQLLSPSNASARVTPGRSSPHNPTPQSPYLDGKSPPPVSAHLLDNKSPPRTSMTRGDGNHANVHPLPLPPVSIHPNMDRSDGSSIKGQWQKGKLLGRGTYGSVYEATNRETGSLCAMKEVDVIGDDTKSAECIRQLEQEIRVLRCLEHPNIVRYLGCENVEDRFCIYLEYVHPGSMNKYIREHFAAVTESVVRNFTRHVLSGLAYLHSKKMVHRDIKGANLLVDASGVVKLADFGVAKHLSGYIDLSLKGSPHWMAPEVLQSVVQKDASPEHAFAVDVWSLGCTVIEMLTGKPPWSEFNGVQAMFNVLNRTPPIPQMLSSEGRDFLNRCLQRDPANRPSAALLLEHPFVHNSFDHTQSLRKQELSGLRLNDVSHGPSDSMAHQKDKMHHLPGTWVKHGRFSSHCQSPPQLHPDTTDHAPASHHSPRSPILDVLPSASLPELNFRSPNMRSQVSNYSPIAVQGHRTYSLPTTPTREPR